MFEIDADSAIPGGSLIDGKAGCIIVHNLRMYLKTWPDGRVCAVGCALI